MAGHNQGYSRNALIHRHFFKEEQNKLKKDGSGLFNIKDDEYFRKWMLLPQSREEMLKRIVSTGTLCIPPEKTEYSNTKVAEAFTYK